MIGTYLVQALLGKHELCSWFAALIFAHVLRGNRQCKVQSRMVWSLLTTSHRNSRFELPLQHRQGSHPSDSPPPSYNPFLACQYVNRCQWLFLTSTGQPSDTRRKAGLLQLLCTWVHDCSLAVKSLLTVTQAVSFLVAQVVFFWF